MTMRAFHVDKTMPLDVGTIHLVGIGGIGMSGIAEILHNLGYQVQGSDVAESANVERLRAKGMLVHIGHQADNIDGASVVVKSTAVKMSNPEIEEARKRFIPVLRRSEMLAEITRLKTTIAIAGSHGKTTTTSLMATLFAHAKLEPTVLNGGILNAYGTNAYLGKGDWMIVEADESDGTFLKIPASVAICTNLDPEHMDYWGDFDALRAGFLQFLQNIPFYGFGVLCIDHPELQAIHAKVFDRRIVTYGFSPQADFRAVNLQSTVSGTRFDVEIRGSDFRQASRIEGVQLPIPGQHNVLNALACIIVGQEVGIANATIKEALFGFQGVKRRFTRTGEAGGVLVIDDYGHHPVEIAATLKAAREFAEPRKGRVIAVAQPHRYTRLHNLFQEFAGCFHNADHVLIADVYTAGEDPIAGADRDHLVQAIRDAGHKSVQALPSPEALPEMIHALAQPNDLVVCLGAGNITAWAYALPQQLEALQTGATPKTGLKA